MRDLTASKPGIYIYQDSAHAAWKRVVINRMAFDNVTHGIQLTQDGSADSADIVLVISNSTIRAQNYGIYLEYPKSYPYTGYGGLCQVTAENVDIVAGLGGAGDGIYSRGAWLGSRITGTGTDPATGYPRVSSITSLNSRGVNVSTTADGNGTHAIVLSNLVVYGCSSDGIRLASGTGDAIQNTARNCTITENGADGINLSSSTAGSSRNPMNCIFASNGGHGLSLGVAAGPSHTCSEGYNCFFNDDIVTNGAVQAFAASDSTADPVFLARHNKPAKYYYLRFTDSPCYHSASDGGNRGAYQNMPGHKGTFVLFR